jgi:hypothetical protein
LPTDTPRFGTIIILDILVTFAGGEASYAKSPSTQLEFAVEGRDLKLGES